MSGRRVVIHCGAAETRAALFVGGEVVRIGLAAARGDEGLPRTLLPGDLVLGRVAAVRKSLNGAFIDLGPDGSGFLPIGRAETPPVEGERRLMAVRRAAIGGKAVVLTSPAAPGSNAPRAAEIASGQALGRIGPPEDAALAALAMVGAAASDAHIVDCAAAATVVRAGGVRAVGIGGEAETEGLAAALAAALERVVALPGGGRLTFDEAEGLAVVDVDAGAAAEGATGRLADKVNAQAQRRLFVELARRRIGGRVAVDFLPPSNAAARGALVAALKSSASAVYPCRFGRLAADGLFDLTAPRTAASLLEALTEPWGEDLVHQGRRLTRDAAAKSAIAALERRLAAAPAARPRLMVGAELGSYLDRERPQWTARLEERYGARFSIKTASEVKDRAYELVG